VSSRHPPNTVGGGGGYNWDVSLIDGGGKNRHHIDNRTRRTKRQGSQWGELIKEGYAQSIPTVKYYLGVRVDMRSGGTTQSLDYSGATERGQA